MLSLIYWTTILSASKGKVDTLALFESLSKDMNIGNYVDVYADDCLCISSATCHFNQGRSGVGWLKQCHSHPNMRKPGVWCRSSCPIPVITMSHPTHHHSHVRYMLTSLNTYTPVPPSFTFPLFKDNCIIIYKYIYVIAVCFLKYLIHCWEKKCNTNIK